LVVDEELLEKLEGLPSRTFVGEIYRHTIGARNPEVENTRGARWNPSDVAAIYTSLERRTAVAEGNYLLDSQSPRPRVRRVVHKIRVSLRRVLDLRSVGLLNELGVDDEALRSDDHWACQRVGEAAKHLGYDGIIVPSARADGSNLILYPTNPREHEFEVLESEVIDDSGK